MIFEEFSTNMAYVEFLLKILQKSCFFHLTRKPEDLAICLYYIILLLLIRRIELYKISIRLKPRVHELEGINMNQN